MRPCAGMASMDSCLRLSKERRHGVRLLRKRLALLRKTLAGRLARLRRTSAGRPAAAGKDAGTAARATKEDPLARCCQRGGACNSPPAVRCADCL